jgi:hypothetical protein
MQRQPTFSRSHIVLHDLVLVRRQAMDHKVQRLPSPVHKPQVLSGPGYHRGLAASASTYLDKPLAGRRAAQAVDLHDARHILTLKKTFHRKQAYGYMDLAIMAMPVSFHDRLAFGDGHQVP